MTTKRLIPTNESWPDRAFRVLLGLVLLALVFVGPKTYWGLLGLVPLLTGLIGSCPLYTVFGISTCAARRGTGNAEIGGGARL
jgi:hypothetical protein